MLASDASVNVLQLETEDTEANSCHIGTTLFSFAQNLCRKQSRAKPQNAPPAEASDWPCQAGTSATNPQAAGCLEKWSGNELGSSSTYPWKKRKKKKKRILLPNMGRSPLLQGSFRLPCLKKNVEDSD